MSCRTYVVALGLALAAGCQRTPAPDPVAVAPTASAPIPDASAPATLGASIYQSETRWENQDGGWRGLADLAGTPVVVAMVFTRCQASCPLIMNDLQGLEAALTVDERARVRFAVFSFDAARDTAATMRAFGLGYGVDLHRWSFFHGNEDAVRELAALIHIRYASVPGGGFDHANGFTVLDARGVIGFQQAGVGRPLDEGLAQLRAMLAP